MTISVYHLYQLPLCLPGGQGKHAADLRMKMGAEAQGKHQESAEAGDYF